MFQDVSLPRHKVTQSNATEDQTKLEQPTWTKASERRVCNIYSLSFIVFGSRSFEPNFLLLVFTQAFHKISIKTSINNTENIPQVTLSNSSAISIDNEASDL